MKVAGVWYRTIAVAADGWSVEVIDQTALPGDFVIAPLTSAAEAAAAIRSMMVRGAPLIGVTAAYGVALGIRADPSDRHLADTVAMLLGTRPTAVNLRWALDRMVEALGPVPPADRQLAAYRAAGDLAELDVQTCRAIGAHGAALLRQRREALGTARPFNILTHCNAGWLATVDWGTALAPVYQAHDDGVPLHVWVDETRPRNQGLLTAWELTAHGVPCTVIVDNAGGHLMRRGQVDLCIVGTDRTTRNGDVTNKIGTYQKALAAADCGIPFYVATPSSSIDWRLACGGDVPIEERSGDELGFGPEVRVANPAFDVTPARLVTGLITERGVTVASEAGLARLFPEQAR